MKKYLLIAGALTLATVACNNESKNEENKDTVVVPSTQSGMIDSSSNMGDTASYERMSNMPVDSMKR